MQIKHWGLAKMADILQTLSWNESFVFRIAFHWGLFNFDEKTLMKWVPVHCNWIDPGTKTYLKNTRFWLDVSRLYTGIGCKGVQWNESKTVVVVNMYLHTSSTICQPVGGPACIHEIMYVGDSSHDNLQAGCKEFQDKSQVIFIHFHPRKCFWKCCLEYVGRFDSASICYCVEMCAIVLRGYHIYQSRCKGVHLILGDSVVYWIFICRCN